MRYYVRRASSCLAVAMSWRRTGAEFSVAACVRVFFPRASHARRQVQRERTALRATALEYAAHVGPTLWGSCVGIRDSRKLPPARATASSAQLWPPRASRPWYTRHTAHMGYRPSVRTCSALCVRLDTTLHTSHCKRNLARQILWRLTRARCNAHGHVSARSTCSASACSRSRTSPGQVCVHDVSVGHHATAVLPAEPWRCAACTACARSSHGSAHAA